MSDVIVQKALPLDVNTMPLKGVHLIEASAGTGKTFNITRIYLRLLLEKQLTVEQILVMTFTKDATEEIRGRIDEFLRVSLSQWDQLVLNDAYFQELSRSIKEQDIDNEQAKLLIKKALLFIDEASIFTIHGFCQQVLSQHAFASGLSFNASLEGDQNELLLQSSRDWYRKLAEDSTGDFNAIVEFWQTPEVFNRQFYRAFSHEGEIHVEVPTDVIERFQALASKAKHHLLADKTMLFEQLVEVKKGQEKEQRTLEFEQLVTWLEDVSLLSVEALKSLTVKSMPDKFLDGKRYSRSKAKVAINEAFHYAKAVKDELKSMAKKIAKSEALAVARVGIEYIQTKTSDKKKQLNTLSFDDLIITLSNCLTDEVTEKDNKQLLTSLLRDQFPFALIDEFQDTDPHQYAIVNNLYGRNKSLSEEDRESGLIMIGDPKQAIYGFRGGDIFTYLKARQSAEHLWVMDTNWRSTASMINGYNRLFYGNSLTANSGNVFGYGIDYLPVKPSPYAIEKQSLDTSKARAIKLVHFPTEEKKLNQSFRNEMAMWCASEILSILESGEAQAQDIALLVRDGVEGAELKSALLLAGLDSVYLSDRTNLWHSDQTFELLTVLEGVLYLENDRKFIACLATRLMGFDAESLLAIQHNDELWQNKKQAFVDLRDDWQRKGFISMALKLLHDHFQFDQATFERSLTNLLHLFELLQSKSQKVLNPQELIHWFESQAKNDFPEQETEIRLASEENLIKIITQHGSKGLEYPIVFVPFATRYKNPLRFGSRSLDLYNYHDDQGQHILSLSANAEALAGVEREANAESIRLFYVAITRAEQKCYLLAAPFDNFHLSPMGLTFKWQKDTDLAQSLHQLMVEQPEDFDFVSVPDIPPFHLSETLTAKSNNASAAVFSGKIERDWWLSSFTSLSRNLVNNGRMTRENEIDDRNVLEPVNFNQNNTREHLCFIIEKGARTGNFLHDVLENVSFSTPDWEMATHWPLKRFGSLPQGYQEADLYSWLTSVLTIKLSEYDPNLSLAALAEENCLKEVEFYFPVEQAHTNTLSALLLKHRQRVSSAHAREYGSTMPSFPGMGQLKGMMHGYIDLVFEFDGRFYVADYKSNFLGDSFDNYQIDGLIKDIQSHHYDLQYLIYSLALHRYLQNIIPDYCPATHFGGVYYLYLRGINGDSLKSSGVYYSDISQSELEQLDQLFAGATSSTTEASRKIEGETH